VFLGFFWCRAVWLSSLPGLILKWSASLTELPQTFLKKWNAMTKEQIKRLKQQILGLNYDSIRKRTKAIGLSKLLVEKAPKHARFTAADFKAFYKSRQRSK
jgi:hypothetical protein